RGRHPAGPARHRQAHADRRQGERHRPGREGARRGGAGHGYPPGRRAGVPHPPGVGVLAQGSALRNHRRGGARDGARTAHGRGSAPGLRAGGATVRVPAERAGSLLRRPAPVVAEVKLPVRLAPPTLAVASTFHYLAQGGCEAVVYRVGEGAVRDGVESGDWWFPGFPLPGGEKGVRFALFAVPYDTGDDSRVRLVALDEVGNRAEAAFVDRFFPRPLKHDTIMLTDAFLNRVVPEIMAQTPEVRDKGSLLANYLEINGELRHKQNRQLRELAARSAPQFLWQEPFLPMRNAKIT